MPFIDMQIGEFLKMHVGTVLILIAVSFVFGVWRLTEAVKSGLVGIQQRLSRVESQWNVFNETRIAEAKALNDVVDIMRQDMSRIHRRLDDHARDIDRLQVLHMGSDHKQQQISCVDDRADR